MESAEAFSNLACFVAEDIYGYAIVDTGATKSMTSVKQMQWLQDYLFGLYDKDGIAKREGNTRFFFAGGGAPTTSAGLVGVPHELGLAGDRGYIWFAMMTSDGSPTLLGLDWIEAAGYVVDTVRGVMTGPTSSVQLDRLPTGHWGLALVPGS